MNVQTHDWDWEAYRNIKKYKERILNGGTKIYAHNTTQSPKKMSIG
jgi:hypothetical protein